MRQANAGTGNGIAEAGVIRIVPIERSAPVDDGVDGPDALGNGGERIQMSDDCLFIGNRYIQAAEIPGL